MSMNNRVTIWTNRDQILIRLNLVLSCNLRQRTKMVDVNKTGGDWPVHGGQVHPAYLAERPKVVETSRACGGVALISVDCNLYTLTFPVGTFGDFFRKGFLGCWRSTGGRLRVSPRELQKPLVVAPPEGGSRTRLTRSRRCRYSHEGFVGTTSGGFDIDVIADNADEGALRFRHRAVRGRHKQWLNEGWHAKFRRKVDSQSTFTENENLNWAYVQTKPVGE
jgi:hypothetical protein